MKYDLPGTNENQNVHDDYSDAPGFSGVSEFGMSYVADYVVQMVQKKTTCSSCHEAVGSRQCKSESAFLTLKDGKFV